MRSDSSHSPVWMNRRTTATSGSAGDAGLQQGAGLGSGHPAAVQPGVVEARPGAVAGEHHLVALRVSQYHRVRQVASVNEAHRAVFRVAVIQRGHRRDSIDHEGGDRCRVALVALGSRRYHARDARHGGTNRDLQVGTARTAESAQCTVGTARGQCPSDGVDGIRCVQRSGEPSHASLFPR